jgi:hypothetical protein
MNLEITLENKKSPYGRMNWHVIVKTELMKASQYFKTQKEALYYIETIKTKDWNKYTTLSV